MKDYESRMIALVAVLVIAFAGIAGVSAVSDDSDAADPIYLGPSSKGTAASPITDLTKWKDTQGNLWQLNASQLLGGGNGAYVAVGSPISITSTGTAGSIQFSITGATDGFGAIKTSDGTIDGKTSYQLSGSFMKTGAFSVTIVSGGQTTGGNFTTSTVTMYVVNGSSDPEEQQISFTSPAAVDSVAGSAISYQASTNISGTTFSADGGNAQWLTLSSTGKLTGTAPSVTTKTSYHYSIKATSPGGQTAVQKVAFEVYPVAKLTASSMNVSGRIGTAITPVTVISNIACTFSTQNVSGSLAELGLAFDASAGTITGTPTRTGNATVKILGYTTIGPSQTASLEISVSIGEDDLAITSTPPTGIFKVGSRWSYTVSANQDVTWSLVGAPSWLGVSGNVVSGQVDGYSAAETVTFTLKATTAGGQTQTQSVSISVEPSLAFTSIPTAACSVTPVYTYEKDGSFRVLASAFDDPAPADPFRMVLGDPATTGADEGSIDYISPAAVDAITGSKLTYNAKTNITGTTFSKVSGDTWLSITSAGVVSGTAPAVTAKTDYTIVIKATSPQKQTIQQTVTISVYPIAKLTASSLTASVNQNAKMTDITVTSNVAVTWSKSGDLPAGVTFTNGKFSGTPTVQGTFPVTVYGATTAGPSQTASVKVTITVGEPVLRITSSFPTTVFLVGKTYTYTPTANVAGSTFTITGAPAWLGVASGKVTGQVTGYTDAATATYTLKATSPQNQIATQTVSITIEPVIAWTSIPTASCVVLASYTYSDDGTPTLKAKASDADADSVRSSGISRAGMLLFDSFRADPLHLSVVRDGDVRPVLGDDANLPTAQNADITETGTRTFEFLWTGENAERVVWDFGDGSSSEGMKVVHTYDRNGTYDYTCTGINSVGSSQVGGRIIVDIDSGEDAVTGWILVAILAVLCIAVAAVVLHRRRRIPSNARGPGRGF